MHIAGFGLLAWVEGQSWPEPRPPSGCSVDAVASPPPLLSFLWLGRGLPNSKVHPWGIDRAEFPLHPGAAPRNLEFTDCGE